VVFLYILVYFVRVMVCHGWQLQFWLHFPATFYSISDHYTAFRAYFVSVGNLCFYSSIYIIIRMSFRYVLLPTTFVLSVICLLVLWWTPNWLWQVSHDWLWHVSHYNCPIPYFWCEHSSFCEQSNLADKLCSLNLTLSLSCREEIVLTKEEGGWVEDH